MNDILVMYGSNYGTTKEYANYIAKQCGAKCISIEQIKEVDVEDYNTIVFGGGVYVGSLHGSNLVKENEPVLRKKRMLIYSVTMSDPKEASEMMKIDEHLKKQLGEAWFQEITMVHLRGALLYSKMNRKHRLMMKVMTFFLKRNKEKQDDVVVKTYGKDTSFVDVTKADKIISWIKDKEGRKDENPQTGECRRI